MALLKISKLGHPILRQRAAEVDPATVATPAFQAFVDDMVETMRESDGVGLAAPQVYDGRRVIAVEVRGPNPRYPDQPDVPTTVVVNPEIAGHSAETVDGWEGCLSLPDLRGQVPRWAAIHVRGLDRHGRPIEFDATGFFARVVQHEVDHLDGVMFLDRMPDLSTLTHLREFQRFWAEKPA